jgi:uncharacterized protein with PQ loop repeat
MNTIVSILHSTKHVPQCIHMIENKSGDGLSMKYIQTELGLNLLSAITTFKMFVELHNSLLLLPVLLEKIFGFSMIITMYCLKKKYEVYDSDYDNDDDWHSVASDEYSDDDWHSVSSCNS